jgi:RimJ/RimL family protein N-acetyltransferase
MMPTEMPVLAHPPVLLREFTGADAGLVQSVAGDPLIPLITTVPVSGTAADARAFIARQHDRLATGAGYSFAIADAATGAAAGQIGLWLRDLTEGRADTGYWVAPRFRGRGYVTAALIAISRWALSLDGIHRLQLQVEPWNEGSWRAAERAGFVREGLLRSWQRVGPERRDMYLYSLLPGDLRPGDLDGPPGPG